ncbi:unnamed protein product [Adineta steineri]|uniref:Uncharacterized protein n=1 Tax=Adineta steineri TaxID=433720 RepID=A0A815JMD2_9BILA|nr:unnamed protein product [Adineta steineri]CAF1383218.1 unnamed protein product [Adineta steineri]CAF3895357.1 unnamed protein product [Adineta steineri]CAF4072954.1 unnamed protein product [Adineta steineri]
MSFEHKLEQNTLIWLNDNLCGTEKINEIKSQLRQVINYLIIYENVDECFDCIPSNDNEQIHFLIVDLLSDRIIPLIYEISQIKMIYILSMNKPYQDRFSTTFEKVIGIFTDLTILCDAIRRNTLICKRNLSLKSNSSSSANRSNQQEAEFMYFRLLTDCLIEMDHKNCTKDEFISMCHCQYAGNDSELEKLNEFNRTYSKENAILCFFSTSANKDVALMFSGSSASNDSDTESI